MNKFLRLSIVGLTILLGACSCSSDSKKLTCTQHIDVLGFIAEEKVVTAANSTGAYKKKLKGSMQKILAFSTLPKVSLKSPPAFTP